MRSFTITESYIKDGEVNIIIFSANDNTLTYIVVPQQCQTLEQVWVCVSESEGDILQAYANENCQEWKDCIRRMIKKYRAFKKNPEREVF